MILHVVSRKIGVEPMTFGVVVTTELHTLHFKYKRRRKRRFITANFEPVGSIPFVQKKLLHKSTAVSAYTLRETTCSIITLKNIQMKFHEDDFNG